MSGPSAHQCTLQITIIRITRMSGMQESKKSCPAIQNPDSRFNPPPRQDHCTDDCWATMRPYSTIVRPPDAGALLPQVRPVCSRCCGSRTLANFSSTNSTAHQKCTMQGNGAGTGKFEATHAPPFQGACCQQH